MASLHFRLNQDTTLERRLADPSREERAESWFDEKWNDRDWRRRNCPGKKVLKKVKEWCQTTYRMSLSVNSLIQAMEDCPEDLVQMFTRLNSHFYGEQQSPNPAECRGG